MKVPATVLQDPFRTDQVGYVVGEVRVLDIPPACRSSSALQLVG